MFFNDPKLESKDHRFIDAPVAGFNNIVRKKEDLFEDRSLNVLNSYD